MDKLKTLTIFTPTYNRAYCLSQCYESLLDQTLKDFIWLIVDDGSTDDTQNVVNKWIEEGKVEIQYHFQENQGMHGGHNTAYELIRTPLNVCIDSDDFMPKDGVEVILKNWKIIENDSRFAGIVGLDADKSGNIIGTKLPSNLEETTLYELYHNHKVKGDKKLVYKTNVINQYPRYPIFNSEKFVPLDYLYLLIDQDYKLFPTNEVFCIVEYMPDGSSLNIFKQYRRHPKGFAFKRKVGMKYAKNFKDRFKNAIHFVSCAIFTKNFNFLLESPKKTITFLAIPFGIILNIYIRLKTRKGF